MSEMIANLRVVFRERLAKLEWMGEATRRQALQKFDRFTEKSGTPRASAIIRGWRFDGTITWATCSGPMPLNPDGIWRGSARPWIGPSGT